MKVQMARKHRSIHLIWRNAQRDLAKRSCGFQKKIPRDPTNNRLIDQVVGCGTSIGGNYCEANEGVSKKDFRNMISRCVKESKETKFFLRMLAASEPQLADEAREYYREAKELHLIFASIFRKTRGEPL